MTLTQLHNELNPRTDKGALHDYINGYYNEAFKDNTKPVNVLEIGVYMGGSLQLWAKHFGPESKIYGFDIEDHIVQEFIDAPNIFFELKNGYSQYTVEQFEDEYFDFIIDDGPHTLGSQLDCMLMWNTKLKPGGKFIIEDIQNETDLKHILQLGKNFGEVKIFDLRPNKGRYDDIIVEITKQK
jgi:23S rRNA U2552 (ribose-2'-O)-methylase RlmE/FtsJ